MIAMQHSLPSDTLTTQIYADLWYSQVQSHHFKTKSSGIYHLNQDLNQGQQSHKKHQPSTGYWNYHN